ncbi:MAG: nuclear transport factor 2 family protein [Cyclobacteriaceae bacterium]
MKNIIPLLLLSVVWLIVSCDAPSQNLQEEANAPQANYEEEKEAIISTLHDETRAAFRRDYESWQKHWVHDPSVSKTYINFADSSLSESLGWEEISGFVKSFIETHPAPEPVPELVADVAVRLYGNGAWVSYEQQDSLRGRKRETRLMEKRDGKWRIANMHTTIYGKAAPK